MKKILMSFIAVLLLTGCAVDFFSASPVKSNKTVDEQVSVKECGDYLFFTVFLSQKKLDVYDSYELCTSLLEQACADYLKISDKGTFSCPGMEFVSEKKWSDGRIFQFRILRTSLKILGE